MPATVHHRDWRRSGLHRHRHGFGSRRHQRGGGRLGHTQLPPTLLVDARQEARHDHVNSRRSVTASRNHGTRSSIVQDTGHSTAASRLARRSLTRSGRSCSTIVCRSDSARIRLLFSCLVQDFGHLDTTGPVRFGSAARESIFQELTNRSMARQDLRPTSGRQLSCGPFGASAPTLKVTICNALTLSQRRS